MQQAKTYIVLLHLGLILGLILPVKALHVHASPGEMEMPCDEGNLQAAHEHCLMCEFVFTEVVPATSTDLPAMCMQVLVFEETSYQAPFARFISFQSLRAPPRG